MSDRSHLSTGRLAKKRPVEEDVYTLAKQRVREAFRLFDTVAVSFSGGKDSTAVLNVTLDVVREDGHGKVIVFFYDEEAIPLQTVDYVRRVAQLPEVDFRWLCLPVEHRNGCSRKSPYWYPWAPESKDLWVRDLPPEAITELPGFPINPPEARPSLPDSVGLLFPAAQYGRVGMILGIRADESITRLRAVVARSQDSRNYIRPWNAKLGEGNLFKVMPVYDWHVRDVWTAPKKLGWDYNRTYDLMAKAGISPSQQRVAPPFGEEPMQALWMFRECFPEIWDRMQRRVPGAATAAMYSRTKLYSFGGAPKKPDHLTWPEFIRHFVEKHPEPYRQKVAKNIQGHIGNHFRKTSDPLAVKAPHPISGEYWNRLLMIAVRGDFKGRKQPNSTGEYEASKRRYDKEMASLREPERGQDG